MPISERVLHEDLKEVLLNNIPFKYAHLVKFERPSLPDARTGRVSTSAQRYTYITDGSRDVVFNDLSKDLQGNLNGPQKYVANKVISIGPIQEGIEAKADTTSIVLDGSGIGAQLTSDIQITSVSAGIWNIRLLDLVDPIFEGFRESDKITVGTFGDYNILNFLENNIIKVSKIDDNLNAGTYSNVTISLSSEEIKSILLNKDSDNYASFINREVYIYRAYFVDGQMIGSAPDSSGTIGPVLLFKGIITNVSFDEDDVGVIKVQWGLSSHWGDFAQVKGRISSDEFHRALDANGIPQPESAIKPIYAYDKGFIHSDTSINLLATYTVMVDKTTIKAKNGFFGLGAKTKVKTVAVPEGRSTNLDFQLQSKSIPVIYGVRVTEGTPIFADTLKTNSSEVYVVYVLSEGQIGGLYDLYIDGKSLICNNQEDFDVRSSQNLEETVDVICRGRADRGDILGGITSVTNTAVNYYYDPANDIDLREVWRQDFNFNALQTYFTYSNPNPDDNPLSVTGGILHGESIALTSPQNIVLDFFSGTESQEAASQLVQLAQSNSFKVQQDYWMGSDSAEYWGPNHRLIDTAYIVGKFTIKEGETTIPTIEYIVRGKVLECYNYDYSYAHHDKATSENPDNFNLGDHVILSTGQSVQIIDKWQFCRPDGVVETRFRFNSPPNLGYVNGVPTITQFTMSKSGATWTMNTYNYVLHSGSVVESLTVPAVVTPNSGGGVTVTYPSNPSLPSGGGGPTTPVIVTIADSTNPSVQRDILYTGSIGATQFSTEVY